jgi:hypothetical protein
VKSNSVKNNPENWAFNSRKKNEEMKKNKPSLETHNVTQVEESRIEDPSNECLGQDNISGQMFPSPPGSVRRGSTVTTQAMARLTTRHHSVQIQTDRTVSSETETVYTSSLQRIKPDKKSSRKQKRILPDSVAKQKPVAYYLPLESLSPIRIGRRVLREITGDTENIFHSSENRNILSGYVASLDPCPLRKPPQQVKAAPRKKEKMSLQEALLRRRKDFLERSEARVAALHAARDARVLRNCKAVAWLAEVAAQSPRSRMLAEPSFTPVPVVRVFNHRDMVRATRERVNELPEVQNLKLNNKKSERYRLNRLMAQIYSSRLQRKVVRGTVSLTHHQLVV